MTWRTPIALAGLAALLVPIVLHLLAQHRAKIVAFPTLQFLPATRPVPAWSHRPSDLLLLCCRLLILLLVVLALAGPVLSATTSPSTDGNLARLVVVDTSGRAQAALTERGGKVTTIEASLDSLRSLAQTIADSARWSRVVMTADPSSVLEAAMSWLRGQRVGYRELVIVSLFPRSAALDSARLAALDDDVGVRLVRVPVSGAPVPPLRIRTGRTSTRVDAVVTADSTTVHYLRDSSNDVSLSASLVIEGVDDERERALRSVVQALPRFVSSTDDRVPALPVRVRFADTATWRGNRARGVPITDPADAQRVVRLQRDDRIATAAANAVPVVQENDVRQQPDTTFLAIAANANGTVILDAAMDTVAGTSQLVIYANVAPLSVTAATLLDALSATRDVRPQELDTAVIDDATLAAFQREARYSASTSNTGSDLSRWFWVLALFTLLLETWLRRSPNHDAVLGTTAGGNITGERAS